MGHEEVNKLAHKVLLVLGVLAQYLDGLRVCRQLDVERYSFGRRNCKERCTKDVNVIVQDIFVVRMVDFRKAVLLDRFFNVRKSIPDVIVVILLNGVKQRPVQERYS